MTRKKKYQALPKKSLLNPINFIATGFGIGMVPFAPGTFGTVLAIPIYIAFWRQASLVTYAVTLIIAIFFSMLICERASKNLGVSDHPSIVIDEMVGFWLTMFSVPANILTILLGFILFRIFDITKPWPIRWFDRNVKGGVGIVLDDLIAGLFSLILLKLFVYVMV